MVAYRDGKEMSHRLRILLEVTARDGRTVFVNPPHVRAVLAAADGARIEYTDASSLDVRQRAEDIAARIDRWLAAAYLGDRYDR